MGEGRHRRATRERSANPRWLHTTLPPRGSTWLQGSRAAHSGQSLQPQLAGACRVRARPGVRRRHAASERSEYGVVEQRATSAVRSSRSRLARGRRQHSARVPGAARRGVPGTAQGMARSGGVEAHRSTGRGRSRRSPPSLAVARLRRDSREPLPRDLGESAALRAPPRSARCHPRGGGSSRSRGECASS